MRRSLAGILLALLLSVLCIPCAATVSEVPHVRDYPGFSDVAADSWCAGAVQLCYEAGLLNGISETQFLPNQPLSCGQAVALAARLDCMLHGGSIAPSSSPDDRAQFLDAAGNSVASFESWEGVSSTGSGGYDVFLYFDEETTRRLAGQPMILILDGYRYDEGHYSVLEDGAAGWTFPLSKDEFLNRDPFGILVDISTSDYSALWYAPELLYLAAQDTDGLMEVMDAIPAFQGDGTAALTAAATRQDFCLLLNLVLTEEDLPPLRTAAQLPDTDDAVALRFYNAGILNGTDAQGAFNGTAPLTRGQAAAILARVLDPAQRSSNPA